MSSNNKFGTIIQIGDVLVSEEVVTEHFACDYAVCKGCCCIIGDSGAPLDESELEPLEEGYPVYSKLMRPQGRAQIGREGFCSIERCFFQGTCKFRKPQSCWLYPVRVTRLTGGGKALNLHRWGICKDAYEKGRREGIRVYQFLRDPLISVFGQDFYDALSYAAKKILDEA